MYVRKIKLGDDVLLIPDSTEALGLGTSAEKNYTDIVTSLSPDLVTSGGVYNALSDKADYEEGLFTPKFWDFSGVEQTFGLVEGYYKKIGNLCYIFISAQTSSDVSVQFINDLPFIPNTNIYGTHPGKEGLVFANGAACFVGVPYSPGQIILAEPATGNLLVEGIYNI